MIPDGATCRVHTLLGGMFWCHREDVPAEAVPIRTEARWPKGSAPIEVFAIPLPAFCEPAKAHASPAERIADELHYRSRKRVTIVELEFSLPCGVCQATGWDEASDHPCARCEGHGRICECGATLGGVHRPGCIVRKRRVA